MIIKNNSGLLEKKYTNNEEKSSFDPTIISAVEGVYVFSPIIGDIDDVNDRITVPAEFYSNLENGFQVTFYNGTTDEDRFIRKISSNVISLYPTLTDALADTNKSSISASAGQKIAIQTFNLSNSVNKNVIVNLDSLCSYRAGYGNSGNIQFVYPSTLSDKSIFSITLSNTEANTVSGGNLSISCLESSDLAVVKFKKESLSTKQSISLTTVYVNSTVGFLVLEA